MKKVISLLIVTMLVLSCSFSAFATSTSNGASADEPSAQVTSIKLTKLPTKLQYTFLEDAYFDVDLDNLSSLEDISEKELQKLLETKLTIDIDLTGAVVEATMSDGSTKNVPVTDCTATVTDPCMLKDLITAGDEGDISVLVRDYTISVEYQKVSTTYKVSVTAPDIDIPEYDDDYEVVSFVAPKKTTYSKADLMQYDYDDEEEPDEEYYLEIDTEGMSAVIMNKETGKLYNVSEDDICCDDVDVEDPDAKDVTFTVDASVDTDISDEEYATADFSFDIKYNVTNKKNDSKKDANDKNKVSTSDTAVDNNAIQTGSCVPYVVIAFVLLSGSVFAYFCTRKKISK